MTALHLESKVAMIFMISPTNRLQPIVATPVTAQHLSKVAMIVVSPPTPNKLQPSPPTPVATTSVNARHLSPVSRAATAEVDLTALVGFIKVDITSNTGNHQAHPTPKRNVRLTVITEFSLHPLVTALHLTLTFMLVLHAPPYRVTRENS